MPEEKYLVCEDSIEGVFTGIYDAYALREGHEHLHIQIGEEENLRLFAVYINVTPDRVKAVKVAETIRRRLGEEAYLDICRALATNDGEKGQAVYMTVVDGITARSGRNVMENLTNPYVELTFRLARNASNESHRMLEFIRFEELEQGTLFSKIGPSCNIMPFIMPHFSDRLPLENFIIYDENHGVYGVHPAKMDWYLVTDSDISVENLYKISAAETEYQKLFTVFCNTIAIKARKNPGLQQQMLPLRFRKYMVEFGE
ncbi:MAG: TIGR03915 family putative DNA repair protein [Clostridiales bacterium]|nr:TIGR03915 family putative DNA repair protein [Clostridiales bacterium]